MEEFEENTGEEFADSKYEELVGKYIEYKSREKEYKSLKDDAVNQIDEMLHKEKIDSKKIFLIDAAAEFECKYVDRITKKTDYMRLAEVVSGSVFDEIVKENTSTYLKISPTAVVKTKRERPTEKKIDVRSYSEIPKAKILSVETPKEENKMSKAFDHLK